MGCAGKDRPVKINTCLIFCLGDICEHLFSHVVRMNCGKHNVDFCSVRTWNLVTRHRTPILNERSWGGSISTYRKVQLPPRGSRHILFYRVDILCLCSLSLFSAHSCEETKGPGLVAFLELFCTCLGKAWHMTYCFCLCQTRCSILISVVWIHHNHAQQIHYFACKLYSPSRCAASACDLFRSHKLHRIRLD